MDKYAMLAAAITGYSMADDFFFMGKEPLGLVTEAAWFLFDLNVLPRAFVKYCLELYFIEAEVYDQVLELVIVSLVVRDPGRVLGASSLSAVFDIARGRCGTALG